MVEITEEINKEIKDILDHERWLGYVEGKVEGAINVLYSLDLDKEHRIDLLSKASGLSHVTTVEIIEPREIEERIYKNEDLSKADKDALLALMSNEAMLDKTEMEHPKQTLSFISSFGAERFIEECLPQIDLWIKNGEQVSLHRVREWLIDKYDLF